jgi:peptide/nickel transport system substrate-binding protein
MSSVSNGYVFTYFSDLEGAPPEPGPYKEIAGIETPDDSTIVFKLRKGTGAALAGALAMPISIPVPKEFAQRYDRTAPSTYGEQHAVFTGPYKVESDTQGKLTGFQPQQRISMVRNPQYSDVGDFRPAFLDAIEIQSGNEDTGIATRRILSGESLASGEIEPPANQLERLLRSNKPELSVVPGGGWRAISLDTARPPFDDIDVRKAVIAGFDRNAARQQRGGEALGPVAQHWIPPGMAGFEESNGPEGWRSSTGCASPRATARWRRSTSARPASRRAGTRAPRRSCSSRTTPSRTSRSRRSPSSSSTRWASRRSCGW